MWLPTPSFSLGWPHSECSMALAGLHRRSNRNENLTAFAVLPFNALIDNEIIELFASDKSLIARKLENLNIDNYILTSTNETATNLQCKYHTVDEYHDMLKTKKSPHHNCHIKIIHFNIRSLNKHFNELISMTTTLDEEINIIALSEFGRKNLSNRKAQLRKLGYQFLYVEPQKRCGGVGLIYNKDINIIERTDLHLKDKTIKDTKLETENIWVKIETSNNDNIIVGLIWMNEYLFHTFVHNQ